MPKQNRPLVRDGRLMAKKKRTDRSYLRPDAAPVDAAVSQQEIVEDEMATGADIAEAGVDAGQAADEASIMADEDARTVAYAPPVPARTPSASASARLPSNRLPTAVRAMQQQGVRKRREFDIHALAIRDTEYAYHELRRIAVLATMVIVTLIILWFVLR